MKSRGSSIGIPSTWVALLLILLLAVPLHSRESVSFQDTPFQPLADEEYIQVWSINFISSDLILYLYMTVSNLGPGNLNNGAIVVAIQNGETEIFSTELSEQQLIASPGRSGVQSGPSYLKLVDGMLEYYAVKAEQSVKLTALSSSGGFEVHRASGFSDANSIFEVLSPVMRGRASVIIQNGQELTQHSGVFSMEQLRTNRSPHRYARHYHLIRNFDTDSQLLIGRIAALDREIIPGTLRLIRNNRLVMSDTIESVRSLESQRDLYSGYTIPKRSEFTLKESGCVLKETLSTPLGGFELLASVSRVLRWILEMIYTRPYIVHYRSQLELQCPATATLRWNQGLSSFYLLGD